MSSQSSPSQPAQFRFRRSAKALITSANRVLLVKEQHADGSGFWTFPGGGLDSQEDYHDALARELFEELRCRVTVEDRLTDHWYVHVSRPNEISNLRIFQCRLRSPVVPNPNEGILNYRWVRPDDVPPSTLLPVRHTIEQSCATSVHASPLE